MAAIRTSNGVVLLKDKKVSCGCCEEEIEIGGEIEFGDFGECDCDTVLCYNATTNPSPATMTVGSTTYTNETPGTNRFSPIVSNFSGASVWIQYPMIVAGNEPGTTIYQGYSNIVTSPTIIRLTGNVGGDIAINSRRLIEPRTWPTEIEVNNVVPQEGEFPCGNCSVPRNGVHPVDFTFVLYPNMFFYISLFSYLECFPWIRLRLRSVGPYTPP